MILISDIINQSLYTKEIEIITENLEIRIFTITFLCTNTTTFRSKLFTFYHKTEVILPILGLYSEVIKYM